jgi:hypothetical protein
MNAFEKVFLRFARVLGRGRLRDPQQGPEGAWWHSWYDLTGRDDSPTLLTFAAGPAGRGDARLDGCRGRGIRHGAAAAACTATAFPEPVAVQRTAWQDDPFARGSYAYMTLGSTTADHDALATPIGGVLHLAGEATWTDDPATVTAALCSGHRPPEECSGGPCRSAGRGGRQGDASAINRTEPRRAPAHAHWCRASVPVYYFSSVSNLTGRFAEHLAERTGRAVFNSPTRLCGAARPMGRGCC